MNNNFLKAGFPEDYYLKIKDQMTAIMKAKSNSLTQNDCLSAYDFFKREMPKVELEN